MLVPRLVLDTNVLYSTMARGLLLELQRAQLVQLFWSPRILDELTHALKDESTSTELALTSPTSLVVPQTISSTVSLPDPNDLHVLACALTANAHAIVTFNHRDFPPALIAPLVARSPDEICCELLNTNADKCLAAAQAHWRSFVTEKFSWSEYTVRLNRARLHGFSRELRS